MHIEETLERLIRAGLKLKLSKCASAREAVICLGHVVDELSLHIDLDCASGSRLVVRSPNSDLMNQFFAIKASKTKPIVPIYRLYST